MGLAGRAAVHSKYASETLLANMEKLYLELHEEQESGLRQTLTSPDGQTVRNKEVGDRCHAE